MGYAGRRIKKTSTKLLTIFYILIILCIIGILVSASVLYLSKKEYRQGALVYEQLRLAQKENDERIYQSDLGFDPVFIDFKMLAGVNSEIAAWLYSKNTIINYPVVQGGDNEYYLTHLFNTEKNKMGCLFIDYRNSRDFSDKNTIIYGHNMKDGSMFASLVNYQSQDYYNEHKIIQLYTPQQTYNLELFADIIDDGRQAFLRLNFSDENDFYTYINELKAHSSFSSDVTLLPEDRIVTLATCTYNFKDARYALFGRLSLVTN